MKNLIVIFFLLISFLASGQQVNAPDSKEFALNTSGQNASGFSLSGFNSTATLLCAVGLPVAPSGTTFYFSTTSGVTASIGYSMSGNKTRISFTGTQANINTVLASMKLNTTGTAGDINISVSATVNPTGYYYLPTNGHFYKPVSGFSGFTFSGTSATNYTNLKNYCTQQTFKGQTGYLITITSADEDNFVYNNVPGSNIIFALTDNVTEGTFKIDAGPEAGTTVRIGATNQQGKYNNWAGGEPNNWGPGEDYVVTKWNGGNQWNDYGPEATAFPGGISGYVIEFGTWANPDDQTFTEFYNNSALHSNGPSTALKSIFTFNFGNGIDKTKFSSAIYKRNDTSSPWTSNSFLTLNGVGRVILTPQLDTAKVYSSAIQLAAGTTDMTAFSETDIGKIYKVTITGTNGGDVWGSGIYTNDSYIPKAAVHAGQLTIGQTKEVFIKVVGGQNDYPSSTQNGITTFSWGAWGLSYQFVAEPSSYKAIINPGQAEYSYVNPNASWMGSGVSRLLIDMRTFGNVLPNSIQKVKILDCYDGPVTFLSQDASWAQYRVPSPLTKVTDGTSTYNSNIRNVNNWNTDYAFTSNLSFTQNGAYKQHKMVMNDYNSTELQTLYGSIVTVSDVYLAFKEFANSGIMGDQTGNEFSYGIQYKNADVDDNNVFNEADCFKLLQHLTGASNLVSSYTLPNTMKLILDSTYQTITKSTWKDFPSYLGKEYPFALENDVINYNYELAVTWKGDVNLSHSPTPTQLGNMANNVSSIRAMAFKSNVEQNFVIGDIWMEKKEDNIETIISVNPNNNKIGATQFDVYYDNSKLEYVKTEYTTQNSINFAKNNGSFISLGSLNTSNSFITNVGYKIVFKQKTNNSNILGLISVKNVETLDTDSKKLTIKVE